MREAADGRGSRGTRTFLCTSNVADPLATMALENIIVDCAKSGHAPLAVYSAAPPFSHPPVKGGFMEPRDRRIEHFTGARVPGIGLDQLAHLLSDPRRHAALDGDMGLPDVVFLQGPSFPEDRLYQAADAVLMLAAKADMTGGWV